LTNPTLYDGAWMVAGPEVARLIKEFREQLRTDHKTQSIMTSQRVRRLLSSKT